MTPEDAERLVRAHLDGRRRHDWREAAALDHLMQRLAAALTARGAVELARRLGLRVASRNLYDVFAALLAVREFIERERRRKENVQTPPEGI